MECYGATCKPKLVDPANSMKVVGVDVCRLQAAFDMPTRVVLIQTYAAIGK